MLERSINTFYILFNGGQYARVHFCFVFCIETFNLFRGQRKRDRVKKRNEERNTSTKLKKKKTPSMNWNLRSKPNYIETPYYKTRKINTCMYVVKKVCIILLDDTEKIKLLLIRVFVDVCNVEISLKQKPLGKSKDSIVFLYFYIVVSFVFLCLFVFDASFILSAKKADC